MNILYGIALVLLLIWILGVAFKVASSFIHLLLLIALVLIVLRLLKGRRRR